MYEIAVGTELILYIRKLCLYVPSRHMGGVDV